MTVCAKFDCGKLCYAEPERRAQAAVLFRPLQSGGSAMAAYVAGLAMGRTALPVVLGVVFHPHAGETVLHQTMPAAGILPPARTNGTKGVNMPEVYIVTEGSYSDYHIVAAFSTKALAKAFCAASHGKYDSIETLELDEPSEWAWVARVRMCRDGELFYPGASIRWAVVPYKSYQTGVSGGSIQWRESRNCWRRSR